MNNTNEKAARFTSSGFFVWLVAEIRIRAKIFQLYGLTNSINSFLVILKPHLLFSFAVFIEEIKIRLISRQSFNKEVAVSSLIYSDNCNNLIQYSVSAVSFNAMCSLEIKSALL